MTQITKFATTPAGQVVIIGAVVATAAYLIERKARKVGNAVNPVSNENMFYQGTNAVGEAVTGDRDFDLGYWLHDVIHGKPTP